MTYSDVQTMMQEIYPGASSGFISTTAIKLFCRKINMRLAGGPHKFSWAIREYSLVLTGATEYDLGTLIPDFVQLYQIPNSQSQGSEIGYQNIRDFNITIGGVSFTIVGDLLRFHNPPTSGTLVIPYYSNYLVESSGGTRKLDFTDGTDISVIPEQWATEFLIEGLCEYYQRKEKEPLFTKPTVLYDGRVVSMTPFESAYFLAEQADNKVHNPTYDFRFEG